jgi:hypothetical protein
MNRLRQKAVHNALRPLRDLFSLVDRRRSALVLAKCILPKSTMACETFQNGALSHAVVNTDNRQLFHAVVKDRPFPECVATLQKAVDDLKRKVTLLCDQELRRQGSCLHQGCNPSVRMGLYITTALDSPTTWIDENWKELLKCQAKITGLDC